MTKKNLSKNLFKRFLSLNVFFYEILLMANGWLGMSPKFLHKSFYVFLEWIFQRFLDGILWYVALENTQGTFPEVCPCVASRNSFENFSSNSIMNSLRVYLRSLEAEMLTGVIQGFLPEFLLGFLLRFFQRFISESLEEISSHISDRFSPRFF